MHLLGLGYEPSFEAAERWRFILTSTSFAVVALIVPAGWLARSLRIQQNGYIALRREQALSEALARHDPLTGLFNRRVFNDQLGATLENGKSAAAVFLIDLDRFKPINDSYGHATGDTVLCEVADRLRNIAHGCRACLARIGGDEFAMIVSDADKGRLAALAKNILADISAPLVSLQGTISVSATCGIGIAHVDANLPDSLLHCADHAMYRAKSAGRARFHFYDPSYEREQEVARQFECDLTHAVAHNHIEPFFQPIVSLPDQTLIGFEILARWQNPSRGMQMPSTFIPILDRLGLIPSMTFSLLGRSIGCAKNWPDHLTLAINVTASMLEAIDFADRLHSVLLDHEFSADRLEVEITEQALVSNISAVRENLSKLRSRGISVALDDFGTGYSGIYHLTHLSIDKIKIDRSFLDNKVPNHAKVVTAILNLANSLQIKSTAEGVEEEEVAHWLSVHRCDFAQGYLFGMPMSADQIPLLIEKLHDGRVPLQTRCRAVQVLA
jgi:diguanylate cyclase (GGDEF)-like protein